MRTLPGVLKSGRAHCLEGALSAAALLEPHGYPPLILDLESTDLLDHTLFLYKENGNYGSVGKSRDVGLDGRKPVFKTIRALVESYVIPYIDAKARLTGYGILDVRALKNSRWKTSRGNVWFVEDALLAMPHTTITTSEKIVRMWRERYIMFKKKHPAAQPDYYPAQKSWQ